jgi:hypothetical protein
LASWKKSFGAEKVKSQLTYLFEPIHKNLAQISEINSNSEGSFNLHDTLMRRSALLKYCEMELNQGFPFLILEYRGDLEMFYRMRNAILDKNNIKVSDQLLQDLDQCLRDESLRFMTINLISQLGKLAEKTIPALIEILEEDYVLSSNRCAQYMDAYTNNWIKDKVGVCQALGSMKSGAKTALPALRKFFNKINYDERIKISILEAIQRIEDE